MIRSTVICAAINTNILFAMRLILLTLLICAPLGLNAQSAATNATYQLSVRDQIEFSVYDEEDLVTSQRIDADGQLRIPLLGTVRLAGMTVRDAERFVEEKYIEERILKNPMITIHVVEYAPKIVSVLGSVESPGQLIFPIEVNSMDIVDVISQLGGFTNMARANNVRVTRSDENGNLMSFTVNVENMISGRGRGNTPDKVEIFPGDLIWVPERFI